MKKKSIRTVLLALTLAAVTFAGCGAQKGGDEKTVQLDPDNPVSLTIWHYYNGRQQITFDELAEEFNATVGKDTGIYVKGYSYGSVSDLEKAITASLNEEVGADAMPDIFSSYADTAYAVQQQGKLADLTEYFTEDELSAYVDSYLKEGYFKDDGALYLLPIAKSTEILMINETDWEPFAEATGATIDELSTTEGITRVAEEYYNWTDSLTPDIPDDGKAFYGRDSMSNYFVIGMKQMGIDIFDVTDGKAVFQTDKEALRRLWDNYYVPYVKGYFAAKGKFRSDDVKTGDIIAYTGSVSSSAYFPDFVEDEDSYPISYAVAPAPVMEGGENYKVQQGAGMAVLKSDPEHEYAASVFLKWFTAKEQNLRYVCDTAYMPVLKESNSIEAVEEAVSQNNIDIDAKTLDCLRCVMSDFDKITFYTTKNFENGYSARKVLDYNLSDKAEADRAAVEEAMAAGSSREEALAQYLTDENFESWYNGFVDALNATAAK